MIETVAKTILRKVLTITNDTPTEKIYKDVNDFMLYRAEQVTHPALSDKYEITVDSNKNIKIKANVFDRETRDSNEYTTYWGYFNLELNESYTYDEYGNIVNYTGNMGNYNKVLFHYEKYPKKHLIREI